MKRLPALLLAMVLVACGTRPQQPAAHPDWSYNSVVYEMNVRQYTPEGTLAAAARHLPRLRELGVDTSGLMPVYPIGVKERKGTLGSYYAISDYEAVNPEFGTLEDFDRFVADAHRLGLRVILDWVANHTSPDARLIEHPADWWCARLAGHTIVQYDWTDIAKLDYGNTDMRAAMAAAMRLAQPRHRRIPLRYGVRGTHRLLAADAARTAEGVPRHLPARRGRSPRIARRGVRRLICVGTAPPAERHRTGTQKRRRPACSTVARDLPPAARRVPSMFTSNHDENSWAGTEFERAWATRHA